MWDRVDYLFSSFQFELKRKVLRMMSNRVDHLTKISKPKGLFGVGTIDHNQEKQSTFSELEKLHEEVNSKVTAVYVHQLQVAFLLPSCTFFQHSMVTFVTSTLRVSLRTVHRKLHGLRNGI